MVKKYFWDDWKRLSKLERAGVRSILSAKRIILGNLPKDQKRLSKLERAGVRSILSAKRIILGNLPKDQVVAIYVKGSFVRREMNEYSDVDTFTILRNASYIKKMKSLSRKYRKAYAPALEFSSSSLWELQHNKKSKLRKGPSTSPAAIVEHLSEYRLIYGKHPDYSKFKTRSAREGLKGMINVFAHVFLPQYRKGVMHRHELLKQVFWLVEREQKFLGNNPPHAWRGLARSVKDEDHIVHDTKKGMKKFMPSYIKKLERYLRSLRRRVQ